MMQLQRACCAVRPEVSYAEALLLLASLHRHDAPAHMGAVVVARTPTPCAAAAHLRVGDETVAQQGSAAEEEGAAAPGRGEEIDGARDVGVQREAVELLTRER